MWLYQAYEVSYLLLMHAQATAQDAGAPAHGALRHDHHERSGSRGRAAR